MELKIISKKLDELYSSFKEVKEKHKNDKEYKKQLEVFGNDLKDLERQLIDKQHNQFLEFEQQEYYKLMNNTYKDCVLTLQETQDLKNKSLLLDIVIKAKQEKEKVYAMAANTYAQFMQMIENIKRQLAQELNIVSAALTQKKN